MHYHGAPTEYKINDTKKCLSSLDDDDLILGFDDAVYDFLERRFRPGMPADTITLTVNHSLRDVQKRDSAISAEISKVLGSMHEPDVLDYSIRYLATSVVGERRNGTFTIWSKTGANGKGLTKNLAAAAFGGYYYEPDQALFASRSVSDSCLSSSDVTKMKGKRLIITSDA